MENPNVDITEYDAMETEGSTYFYLKVDGDILLGNAVPSTKAMNIPSENTGGQEDHGEEPGTSSGTQDDNPLPVETGEDAIYIFLDIIPGQGYENSNLPFGADYMVEIMGQEGRIVTSKYFRFIGETPNEWSWDFVRNVNAASGLKELETSADAVPLNVYYHMVDWDEKEDWCGDEIIEDPPIIDGTRAPGFPTTDTDGTSWTQMIVDTDTGSPGSAINIDRVFWQFGGSGGSTDGYTYYMIRLTLTGTAPATDDTFGLFFDWDNDGDFETYFVNNPDDETDKYGYSNWSSWSTLTEGAESGSVLYSTADWGSPATTYGIIKFAIADANHNFVDGSNIVDINFTIYVASDDTASNPYWDATGTESDTNIPATESSTSDYAATPFWPADGDWNVFHEEGTKDTDARDGTQASYYVGSFQDDDFIYLRLGCQAMPSLSGGDDYRYKFFLDTVYDGPDSLQFRLSGGKVYNAEYIFMVENTDDANDDWGVLYLCDDTDNSGGITDDWGGPPGSYWYNGAGLFNRAIAGWRITDAQLYNTTGNYICTNGTIDMYLRLDQIDEYEPPYNFNLSWATEGDSNANLDQAPESDRADSGSVDFAIFELPEFPTILLPVSGVMALFIVFRKKTKKEPQSK